MKKSHSLLVPIALLSVTLIVMSGACSQHSPGSFEGGGRDIPTSVVGDIGEGEPPPPDASVQDNFVAPDVKQDVFQLPDVGGQGG